MKLLDRYIAAVVIGGTLVALLVVVGLNLFFTVIEQVEDVGKNGYTLGVMLQYVALTAPQSLYDLFPMAALLGSLMGMGALAANSELIAMRAAGMSVWRVVRSVMQGGALMLLVVVLIGELVAPYTEQQRHNLRAMAAGSGVSLVGGEGLWVRDGQRFIHARSVLDQHRLAGINVYSFADDGRLDKATRATIAEFVDGEWVLHGVQDSNFSADAVTVDQAATQVWPTLLEPGLLDVVSLKPKSMSAADIEQLVGYLNDNGLDSRQYRFAFWGRFMTPVSALVMLLISVPFVFGSLRTVSAGQRLFVGMLVGFGFYILSQIVSQMGQVYGLPALATMLVPNVLFAWLGIRAIQRLEVPR